MRDAALQSVAIGFFDGVHLGHRKILNGADSALTFVNHPLTVLKPDQSPELIMTFEERIRAIGLPTMVMEFTNEIASMSAAKFAEQFLKGRIVRCGANWKFGKNGEGDAKWLKDNGYAVEVVPFVEYKGAPISSSRIRKAMQNGEVEDVAAMLGRDFVVRGIEEPGKGIGREIGYPTINLRLGVYAAEVNGEKAIVNYGRAPTMGEKAWKAPIMEVHLLNFLRDERKFDSVDELKNQITEDIRRIK